MTISQVIFTGFEMLIQKDPSTAFYWKSSLFQKGNYKEPLFHNLWNKKAKIPSTGEGILFRYSGRSGTKEVRKL